MSLNGAGWSLWISYVPNLQLLVVAHGRENELIEVVPGNVLDDGAVRFEIEHRLLIQLV